MQKNSQPIGVQIVRHTSITKRGRVFSARELVDAGLGSRAAVDQALHRLTKAGRLRRVARGLYSRPEINRLVGEVPPSPEAIVSAIARATGETVQVSGVQAANALGLSTQLPGKLVYWTSGVSRVRRVGGLTITFRHGSPSRMAGEESPAGAILQAVRYLGPEAAGRAVAELRRHASPRTLRVLRRSASTLPAWMSNVARAIAAEAQGG